MRNEKIKILVFYILVIAIIYAPVVFFGKSIIPSLLYPHGVTQDFPFGYQGRKALNTFNIDLGTPAYYEFPINGFVGKLYRSAKLPLWNPYQGSGTPLAAQYSTRVFFPYQIAEDVSPYWLWDYFILGRLLFAGFFTYLFLRLFSVSMPCAFLGGLFYIFSGTFTWFINLEQYANVAMMIPVLMYCTEKFIQTKSNTWIALCALAFGMSLLAGQPEIFIFQALLTGVYFIFRIVTIKESLTKKIRYCLRFFVSGLLGLGLSLIVVAPFFELTKNAYHIHHAGGTMGVQSPTPLYLLISILMPAFFRMPTFYRISPENGVWDTLGGYSGTLVILLIIMGVLCKGQNKRFILFFFLSGLFIILKNIGSPLAQWLGHLPLFDQSWSNRWAGPVWTFSFAVAAGFGIESLLLFVKSEDKTQIRKKDVIIWSLGFFLFALGTILLIFFKKFFPVQYHFSNSLKSLVILFQLVAIISGLVILIKNKGFLNLQKNSICTIGISCFLISVLICFLFSFIETIRFYPAIEQFDIKFFVSSALIGLFVSIMVIISIPFIILNFSEKGAVGAIIALSIVEMWIYIPKGYDIKGSYFELGIFILSLVIVLALAKEKKKIALVSGLTIIALISFFDFISPYGLPIKYNLFEETPYVDFLKKQKSHFRVMAAEGILMPNYASALGIYDVRFINALTIEPYHKYTGKYLDSHKMGGAYYGGKFFFDKAASEENSSFLWLTGIPQVSGNKKIIIPQEIIEERNIKTRVRNFLSYYSLLGVKFFLVPKSTDLNENLEQPLPIVYDSEIRIYENPDVYPRAFIVHKIEKVDSYKDSFKLFRKVSLREVAILEEEIYEELQQAKAPEEVRIIDYQPNKVVIEAKLDAPGLLILSDTFYPGWSVYIDGELSRIYRANGLMRAVFLQEGKHSVVFSYLPLSFKIGLVGFGISLFFIIVLLIIGYRKKLELS